MRVLLVSAEFGMTGAGLMLCRYGAHLARSGRSVVVHPRPGQHGPLEREYRDAGIEIAEPERLRVEDGTVVICNTVLAAREVVQIAAHAPVMWWLHEGEIGLELMMQTPARAMAAFRAAMQIVLPTPVLRDRIYRSFLFNVPEHRLAVIPYGIEAPATALPARAPGPVRVVFIGSLYRRKRPMDMLHALQRLGDLDVEMHFVGKGDPSLPQFAATADAMGARVRLYGEVAHAQAMEVLDQADIFALPSASECLPISPIEAGMRGIPSVLSDLAGHEGMWRHGQNCLMHPVGDADLLAHMLRALVADPPLRHRLGAAARMTAHRFTTELMNARMDLALTATLRQ